MRKKRITKLQIIEATAQCILDSGLENVSVDEIAKTAKIAKGSVYVYFQNKDELLGEGAKLLIDQRIKQFEKLLTRYDSAALKLRVLFESTRILNKNRPESINMIYAILIGTPQGNLNNQVYKDLLTRSLYHARFK